MAVKLAREVADSYSSKGRRAGLPDRLGRQQNCPSLGHITLDDMVAVYLEQAVALIEAGVDLLLVETCAGSAAGEDRNHRHARRDEEDRQAASAAGAGHAANDEGTMLLGTDIGAALTSLEPYDIDIFGLNCATGPKEMNDAVRYLGLNSPKQISVLPNAGMPQNVGGKPVYELTAGRNWSRYHKLFISEYGVRVVGGCCGTTPDHIKAVVDACANLTPAKRNVKITGAASSAYTIGSAGSRSQAAHRCRGDEHHHACGAFENLVRSENYDEILAMAKRLADEGSHMLDVCMRDRGRGRERLYGSRDGEDCHACAGADCWSTRPKRTSSRRR